MGGQSELSGKVLGAGDPAGREFRSLFDDALSRTGGTDHRFSGFVLPRYHTIGRQTTKCDRLSHTEPPPAASALPRLPEPRRYRSEEHTSELQSLRHLVCRLLLEK